MKISTVVSSETIEQYIFLIRGEKVMLDLHLARLYLVSTTRLNEQVRRNMDRFPGDFMFQLTKAEFENLRSQIATSSWGGTRYLPYVFTEQGVAMLSSVLRSKRAVRANVAIMRTFVKLRMLLATRDDLALKLAELETKYESHDKQIKGIFEAIRQLMAPPQKPKREFGFR